MPARLAVLVLLTAAVLPAAQSRQDLHRLYQEGNYQEAYDGLRRVLLAGGAFGGAEAASDLTMAVQALRQLGRVHEVDEFRDRVVQRHADDWRVLAAAAQTVYHGNHYGYLIAGEFRRGHHRGGGRYVQSQWRDRVRALQLMQEALPHIGADASVAERASFYGSLSDYLLGHGGVARSWHLQALTDLAQLPDLEAVQHLGWQPQGGAPVDADGEPVWHREVESWQAAESDGQRWRWALAQLAALGAVQRSDALHRRARFAWQQYGVQTMVRYGGLPIGRAGDDEEGDDGPWSVETLKQDESIARLAVGVRRFQLDPDYDFIALYKRLVAEELPHRHQALQQLGQIFENRRQYPVAADYWRLAGNQQRLRQIVGPWGRFEPTGSKAAGTQATLGYRFRNGRQASFTAHRIKVDKLLADVRAYIESKPGRLDWHRMDVEHIGMRMVQRAQMQYRGEEVARWQRELQPAERHFDRRVDVEVPLQDAGAYLITARMADGNASQIVLWLNDSALLRKPIDNGSLYYLADARSGEPIADAELKLFGYRTWWEDRQMHVATRSVERRSDAQGMVTIDGRADGNRYQWLVSARKGERFAYLGFQHIWYGDRAHDAYDQTKAFFITDRPVYRPGDELRFKVWARRARYDLEDAQSQFAGRRFTLRITDPKNEKFLEEQFTADAYGGFTGTLTIPDDATLGQYAIVLPGFRHGSGHFRIEEYKKPEYEVSIDAPDEAITLGEQLTATVQARYYFGAPVTDATVRYKVQRSSTDSNWLPPGRWDWLYGRGYWWFASDYDWYPGWERWGCIGPHPWWWQRHDPPELVVENEVPIGPDGSVEIVIDTSIAKALHGDQDHEYQITAEVVDASRRSVVGSGSVLAAREPFRVTAWVDRGFYRPGDTVHAQVAARGPSGEAIRGSAELSLLRVRYDDQRRPVEEAVQRWELELDATGSLEHQLLAAKPGQYRLRCVVDDGRGHEQEGAYLFTVAGEEAASDDFRFAALELLPDAREYAAGDELRLLVASEHANATVLLFLRPEQGRYPKPRVLRLQGRSREVAVPISQADMPNCYIEAVTVADGQVHRVVREIVVPPASRVLDVELVSDAAEYRPGAEVEMTLRLRDEEGEPFVGSTVLSVYDQAVEYIAGGSNVPAIHEHFWQWRRQHRPTREDSLSRRFGALYAPGQPHMQSLGVFGDLILAEDDTRDKGGNLDEQRNRGRREGVRVDMMAGAAAPAMESRGVAADMAAEPSAQSKVAGGGDDAAPLADVQLRSEFADSAFWAGELITDADGEATVQFTLPEDLTTWQVRAWAMGHGTRVGQGTHSVISNKKLLLRMQAPRFFVERDEVVLSANVHNEHDVEQRIRVGLTTGELLEEIADGAERDAERWVTVPPHAQQRVDWRVRVLREGEAQIAMTAQSERDADGVRRTFPVLVHGAPRTQSFSLALRGDRRRDSFRFTVPEQRRPELSELVVQWSPSLAGALVDALPYLASYPHGCTEQTLNRFLPTVLVQRVLQRTGVDLAALREQRAQLDAQVIGDVRERAGDWQQWQRPPVFDPVELDKMARTGLLRLEEMQNSDGGWGWFSGSYERSYPHTTAVVLRGLLVARRNDLAVPAAMIDRGAAWLRRYQAEQHRRLGLPDTHKQHKAVADDTDALCFHVLAELGDDHAGMRGYLYRDRTKYSVYGKALFALAMHAHGHAEELAMLTRNIEQFLMQDDENQTAWLELPNQGYWWYWYGSEFEAHAAYLQLLARTAPGSEKAARLVKYLLNNRRHAGYWNSTRDTAYCIEAMAEYLEASGESRPDLEVVVLMDGVERKRVRIGPDDLFAFDGRFALDGHELEAGEHEISIHTIGDGPLYCNAWASNFSKEDVIPAAGLEVRVERRYYKLQPIDAEVLVEGARGQALHQQREAYERVALQDGAELVSGDLIEVELLLASKNDYEYLLIEDPKPAGCEPVDRQSGYLREGLRAYRELRDQRISLFVQHLARGQHSLSYRLRAEIPGRFSALPARIEAMYAPELRGNSGKRSIAIRDAD